MAQSKNISDGKKRKKKKQSANLVIFKPDPNAKTKADILKYLGEGNNKRDSALLSAIDESTFYRWIKDDASFASEVDREILGYKRKLIKIISVGSIKKPEIALKILAVKYGDEWNPEQKVKHSGEVIAEVPGAVAMIDALQKILEETNDDIQTKQETAESDETAHIDILQEQGEETVPSN